MINIDELIKEATIQLVKAKKEGSPAEQSFNERLGTLKLVKTRIMEIKTAKNAKPYDEQTEINMLRKMVKEREETAKIYANNGRNELARHELMEMQYIKDLLPEEISEEIIAAYIDSEFSEITKAQMGTRIKDVKDKFPTADGAVIARLIKERIR